MKTNKATRRSRDQFIASLLIASATSVLLFVVGAVRNHSLVFDYLIFNLFLAWLPLVFSAWIVQLLQRKVWSSWEGILASILWLLFLPNSFYMVSDFIHLLEVPRVDILYDAVMFTSFIFVAFTVGLCSLYLVHREFSRRFSVLASDTWLGGIILLCSFAIYLGRDLRWNSWDILTNPGGLLFDISDRVIHPSAYPQMFLTIGIFAVLISSVYYLTYKAIEFIQITPR